MRIFSTRLILICSLIFVFAKPAFASDAQFWQTFSVEGEVYKDLTLQIAEEIRFCDNMSELYYAQTDIGLMYALTDWFKFGAMYRQVFENRGYDVDESFDTWRQEKRPIANLIFDLKTKYIAFSDRSQFEFRFIDGARYNVRYRNKLSIEFPIKFEKVKFAPYVADEIFVDINNGVFNTNRFYTGTKFKIIDRFALELYYLLQSSKKTNYWSNFSALGFKAGVIF